MCFARNAEKACANFADTEHCEAFRRFGKLSDIAQKLLSINAFNRVLLIDKKDDPVNVQTNSVK